MSSTLEYEYPVWFRGTPLKHRTPKVVCGKFIETFEVTEVDADDVNAAIDIMIAGEVGRYFEIEGRFFKLVGRIDSEAVKSRYKSPNSPIPRVGHEHSEMRTQALSHAKAEGIGLFPKRAPHEGVADTVLKREWFSDVDMQWLDKRRHEVDAFLSHLRCSEGDLYEPIVEPAFVVNLRTERGAAAGVWVEFRARDEDRFYWGYPVAYFGADQQDEALAYTSTLASRHGLVADPFERRTIEVHQAGRLTFDPFPAHLLEAATLACRTIPAELVPAVDELHRLLGPGLNAWRKADVTEETLLEVDRLLRQCMERSPVQAFSMDVAINTLIERWDDRPIDLRNGPTDGLRSQQS